MLLLVGVLDGDAAFDREFVLAAVQSIGLLISCGGLVTTGHRVNDVELVRNLLVVSGSECVGTALGLSNDTTTEATIAGEIEAAIAVGSLAAGAGGF